MSRLHRMLNKAAFIASVAALTLLGTSPVNAQDELFEEDGTYRGCYTRALCARPAMESAIMTRA